MKAASHVDQGDCRTVRDHVAGRAFALWGKPKPNMVRAIHGRECRRRSAQSDAWPEQRDIALEHCWTVACGVDGDERDDGWLPVGRSRVACFSEPRERRRANVRTGA